jgi:hypothetical protein
MILKIKTMFDMFKRKQIIAITVIIAALMILVIIIKIKMMKSNDFYIITAGMGPVIVNQRIEKGYKIIGKGLLWNPHPRPITLEDVDFIKSKLPEWLAEHHHGKAIDIQFQEVNNQKFINKMKYEYTVLYYGEFLEADIYTLTLNKKEKTIKIYIGKGDYADLDIYPMSLKTKIGYPFYDVEWHNNNYATTPYKPGDLW